VQVLVWCDAMGEQTRVSYLLLMRLFCGWVFLNAGLSKIASGWLTQPELAKVITGWLHDGKPYSFYAAFLRSVVLPHAMTFAATVAIGEVCVGAALLAGLFTRVAAAGGVMLVGNFLLGRGDGFGANNTMPILIMCVTMILTSPGRALGLDAALRGKLPRWLS
jgi:thiosulfate dehydrogenase [quinone] large subunit